MQNDPYLEALRAARQGGAGSGGARGRGAGPGPSVPPQPAHEDDPYLAALDQVRQPKTDDRSVFSHVYDAVFTAPEAVTNAARRLANAIDAPAEGRSKVGAIVRGGIAGSLQGAASLLTPGDVALTATGLGPLARTIRGVKRGADAIAAAQTAANVATVARGGERIMTAESPSDAFAGTAQVALGSAGNLASRRPAPSIEPAREPLALPPAPDYVVGADGVAVPAGVDVPVAPPPPDASFVRGEPAEFARRDVRGLLPPAPKFIAGEGGAVGALDSVDDPFLAVLAEARNDPSFVRGVPAEYARREVAGLLAPHREPIITPAPETSGVRSARAAVVAREGADGPVTQYASEPTPEDFEAFTRAFDEMPAGPSSYRKSRGEAGFANPEVLRSVAGAAAGATAGTATIEKDDPYWKKVAKVVGGVALGAAAGPMFRGRPASMPVPPASILPMHPVTVRGRTPKDPPAVEYRSGVPRVGRSGTAKRDPLAGIEVFLGKFSNPLVRDGIKERLLANGGFSEQRRESIDPRTVGKFAEQVKVDVTKALPKGSAASAEVVTAYARGLRQTQERIGELAAKVNDGTATDADVLALEMARADGDVILASLMGLRSEAGRALGALRSIGGLFDSGNVELVRGAAALLREDAAKFARAFADQPADDLARYQWLKTQGKPTLWDRTRSYWYANILSGVKTHERNILGNVFNALGNFVSHPIAAGLDAARSAATGAQRQVLFSELPRGVVGAFAGMDRGLSDAIFTLRHGINPIALQRTVKAAEVGKLDLPRYEFKGGGANPFNWPGRFLDSADAFFRSVSRNTELYESAYTAAKREGLKGAALEQRIADLLTGSSPESIALREQAEHVAARAVFQEKGGPITSFLAQGYKVPIVGQAMLFTIPFLRTPGNILRQGLEASPFGFAMKEARSGGRTGALAQGKAAAGSLAAGYLAWLASTGRLSGAGPSDRKERAALMETGWRPNSVKVGDHWVSYALFQPVSVQAAIIANAFEAWRSEGAQEKDMPSLVGQTMARAANSFTEQSFLEGLFTFQQALNDPDRFGSRWVGRTAQGLSPFAGFQRSIQQGLDPTVRQPNTVLEQIQAATPGLSDSLPAKLDRYGEEVQREGGAARRVADPFNTSTVRNDRVSAELARLGVNLPELTARMVLPNNRILSEAEAHRVKQEQGREVRAALEAILDHPNYGRYPDLLRTSLLSKAIERARDGVAKRVRNDVMRGRTVLAAVEPTQK